MLCNSWPQVQVLSERYAKRSVIPAGGKPLETHQISPFLPAGWALQEVRSGLKTENK